MAEIITASPNQDLEANLERIRIARDRGLLAGAESPGAYSGDPLYGLDTGVAPSTEEGGIKNKLFNYDGTEVPYYQELVKNASNPGTGEAPSERTQQASSITRSGTGEARPDITVDESLALGAKVGLDKNREQEKGNFLENLLGQIDLNKLLNSKTVKLLLEGVAGMSGEQQSSGGSALSGFTTSLNQARADDQQAMLDEQDRLLEQSRYDASAAASQVRAEQAARRDNREEVKFRDRNDVNPVPLNKPTENFIKDMISNSRIVSAIVEEKDGTWFSRRIGESPSELEVINAIVSEVVKIQHSNRVPLAEAFSAYEQSVGSSPSSSNTSDESVASGDAFGSIK